MRRSGGYQRLDDQANGGRREAGERPANRLGDQDGAGGTAPDSTAPLQTEPGSAVMFRPVRKQTTVREETVEVTSSEVEHMVPVPEPVPPLQRLSTDDWPDQFQNRRRRHPCSHLSKMQVIVGLAALCVLLLVIVFCLIGQAPAGGLSRAAELWDSTVQIIDGKYVETMASCGRVRGRVEEDGFVFRAVPYAVQPVGPRRFQYSDLPRRPSDCWHGVLPADGPSRPCPHQGDPDSPEACLTVDVYTPQLGSYADPLPVVVYLGGSSLSAETPPDLQPSARLARRHRVVFVAVHVRRGVLGFLASELLARTSHPHTSGNYGLSDLVTALEWVSINAPHFGGSPALVTLLGHQAGATLMSLLTTVPRTKPLYTHMWLTGGAALLGNSSLPSLPLASERNSQYLTQLGCKDPACLRNKTVRQLQQAVPSHWHRTVTGLPRLEERHHSWLVRDGFLVTQSVSDVWAEPQSQHQLLPDPLLVLGTNAQQDGSPDLFTSRRWNVSSEVRSYLSETLGTLPGDLADRAAGLYLDQDGGADQWKQMASMVSDVRTVCPLYRAAKIATGHFTNNVYFYVAQQPRNGAAGYIADDRSDIEAILDVYQAETNDQRSFVSHMQQLFYGFVHTGSLEQGGGVRTGRVCLVGSEVSTVQSLPRCQQIWSQGTLDARYTRRD